MYQIIFDVSYNLKLGSLFKYKDKKFSLHTIFCLESNKYSTFHWSIST